ncbi:tetratricopeptide repeat protein, partial [Roseiarcus sp.]|uniref:tetratricopeptide repeat protein n=1 Tax=Roseiarcus sp. TaxID=1969460 RepID=UPI003F9CF1AD
RDGQAIFEDLSRADPGNAGWRRDLSVCYDNIGDVLVAQGDLAGALKAFRDGLAIREALSRADPGNATCRCPTKRLATCWSPRATSPGR